MSKFDNMSGNVTHSKDNSLTLKKQDYRRSKQDEDDRQIRRKVAGFTPVVNKVKPAGKCSGGIPLYFVNGGSVPQHVPTPADDAAGKKHKETCSESNAA